MDFWCSLALCRQEAWPTQDATGGKIILTTQQKIDLLLGEQTLDDIVELHEKKRAQLARSDQAISPSHRSTRATRKSTRGIRE